MASSIFQELEQIFNEHAIKAYKDKYRYEVFEGPAAWSQYNERFATETDTFLPSDYGDVLQKVFDYMTDAQVQGRIVHNGEIHNILGGELTGTPTTSAKIHGAIDTFNAYADKIFPGRNGEIPAGDLEDDFPKAEFFVRCEYAAHNNKGKPHTGYLGISFHGGSSATIDYDKSGMITPGAICPIITLVGANGWAKERDMCYDIGSILQEYTSEK